MAREAGARGSAARSQFVATTAQLLQRQGYSATGLNEIVARSGAPKGSLYFHFPGGKQELAAAAMQQSGAQLQGAIAAILAAEPDPGRALASLIDALALGLSNSHYRDGCPIATVALETAAASQELRETAAAVFDSWLEAIATRLCAAGFPPDRAARRALLALSAIEGALILARARRDPGPLEAVREELLELFA